MGKIFKNQSSLKIELTTSVGLGGASAKIKYRKPSGTEGEWSATITDSTDGVIEYDLVNGEIDEAGIWQFWASVVFSDRRTAPGEVASVRVYEEGN